MDPPFWAKTVGASSASRQHLWWLDKKPRCMVTNPDKVPSKRKFPADKPPRRACRTCLKFVVD